MTPLEYETVAEVARLRAVNQPELWRVPLLLALLAADTLQGLAGRLGNLPGGIGFPLGDFRLLLVAVFQVLFPFFVKLGLLLAVFLVHDGELFDSSLGARSQRAQR